MLQSHPQVWMPPIKELHYFDGAFRLERAREKHRKSRKWPRVKSGSKFDERDLKFLEHAIDYDAAKSGLDWYLRLFASKGDAISGDITPAYITLSEESIAEISEALPKLRIILLVRDPVSRAWSGFNRGLRQQIAGSGNALLSKEELAIFHKPTSIDELRDYVHREGIRQRAAAVDGYMKWRRYFGESRIIFEFFDNIESRPAAVRSRILSFLGLPLPDQKSQTIPVEFNRKANRAKRQMSNEVRAFLIDHYKEEIMRCAEVFGGPAEDWPRRYGL